jgi:ribosomal protein S18 acetylase RimI-like enzyme
MYVYAYLWRVFQYLQKMSIKIDFSVIKKDTAPVLIRIEQTYTASFPVAERRDFLLVKDLLVHESRFTLCALLHENRYIGFISFWQFDAFTYIEHFAIDESDRNKGWGAIVMKQFTGKIYPVVLETEPPCDELSTRRMGFYQRLGFVTVCHRYLQPPYRKGEPWLPLCLMSYGDIEAGRQFKQIRQTIYRYVYNRDF